jgi:hypothetical protein
MRALSLVLLAALAGSARADGSGLLVTPRTPELELDWPPGRAGCCSSAPRRSRAAAWPRSGAGAPWPRCRARRGRSSTAGSCAAAGATATGCGPRTAPRKLEVTVPATPPLAGVVAVACGAYHTLFLDGDGASTTRAASPARRPRGPTPGAPAIPGLRDPGHRRGPSDVRAVDGEGAVWVWGKAPPDQGAGALRAPVRARWGRRRRWRSSTTGSSSWTTPAVARGPAARAPRPRGGDLDLRGGARDGRPGDVDLRAPGRRAGAPPAPGAQGRGGRAPRAGRPRRREPVELGRRRGRARRSGARLDRAGARPGRRARGGRWRGPPLLVRRRRGARPRLGDRALRPRLPPRTAERRGRGRGPRSRPAS